MWPRICSRTRPPGKWRQADWTRGRITPRRRRHRPAAVDRRGDLRAHRRSRRSRGARAPPAAGCRALVRAGQPDHPRPRRRVDVHRRPQRPAAAVAAPAGDGRGRAALRLPGRPVGPTGADQPLPRRHDVRVGRGCPTGDRRRARRAPPRHRHRPGRPPLRGLGSAPRVVGPPRRGRQLPAGLPALRLRAADRRRVRRVRRPERTHRRRPRCRRRAGLGRRRASPAAGVPSRAGRDAGRPRGRPLPRRQPAAAARPAPGLPADRRCRRGPPAIVGAVAAAPAVAPHHRGHVARAGGELVTRTIRWALPGT